MTKTFFTLQELIYSDTAERLNIDNRPTNEETNRLYELINELLNPFRVAWDTWCINNNLGTPAIRVSSGFRSANLNKAIGGSNTSAHSLAYAADLIPYNRNMKEFRMFAEDFLKGMMFDQCIFEEIDNKGIPQWIHLGLRNAKGEQRMQFMTYKNKKYTLIKV